jgi:hypothetical protein
MRLLHIQREERHNGPLKITLRDFSGRAAETPHYAILSHRWREEEVLFIDMIGDSTAAQMKNGYRKLQASCNIALDRGVEYLWCDTCCIDKASSAELSEAINSMYMYYAKSQVCIVYLDDIEDNPQDDDFLNRSVWFTRGWTLQELIAPDNVHFFSLGWKSLGTKSSLCRQVSVASGIAEDVLALPSLLNYLCISEKMSWAARRVTTRAEDCAYALMGIFSVHMPPLYVYSLITPITIVHQSRRYGEGAQNAFRRLQLEILQTTTDHTLFAWDSDVCSGDMVSPRLSPQQCLKRWHRKLMACPTTTVSTKRLPLYSWKHLQAACACIECRI